MAEVKSRRALRVLMRINEDNRPLYEKQCPEEANKYFLPFDFWLADILDSTGETKYSGLVISTDMFPRHFPCRSCYGGILQ